MHVGAEASGGSSPRMPGAHIEDGSPGLVARIIPADAGSTREDTGETFVFGDHPRGCGEHNSYSIWPHRVAGSSPRMREALH